MEKGTDYGCPDGSLTRKGKELELEPKTRETSHFLDFSEKLTKVKKFMRKQEYT
jgi:hypothetical protein